MHVTTSHNHWHMKGNFFIRHNQWYALQWDCVTVVLSTNAVSLKQKEIYIYKLVNINSNNDWKTGLAELILNTVFGTL